MSLGSTSSECSCFLSSTIGKKYLMAITAIFWSLFVMAHMLGNMLIFLGAETYNKYSHTLTSNPFIYVAEAVLLLLLLIHIFTGFNLKTRNWYAKPTPYAVSPVTQKAAPMSAKTMIYTGTVILAFIIWHLITFKFGQVYMLTYQNTEMRDLYRLVIEKFHEPFYVFSYCIVMLLIGVHLFHGIKSIFQSLGVNHPRYNCFIKYFGYTYALVVALGFFSQPLYVFLVR